MVAVEDFGAVVCRPDILRSISGSQPGWPGGSAGAQHSWPCGHRSLPHSAQRLAM